MWERGGGHCRLWLQIIAVYETAMVRTKETGVQRASRQRRLAAFTVIAIVLGVVLGFAVINPRGFKKVARYAPQAVRSVIPNGIPRVAVTDPIASKMVEDAKKQLGTTYDASYEVISYPNGDVARSHGACTDVVVRSMRAAKIDLQKLIHQDMKSNFGLYPHQWGLSRPDKNIDHRRVPNQMKFFSRFGQVLPTAVNRGTLITWKPGDVVCWDMNGRQLHTGIISDGLSTSGVPLVIHNGWLCVEDDSLTRWKIIGHYRYPKRNPYLRTASLR